MLRKEWSGGFYQGSECRVIGSKRVTKPQNRWWGPALDRHHVKSHDVVGVAMVARVEHGSCANNLPLLVAIHGVARLREIRCAPESHLYKYQALVVQHNQVNFAAAASKVARNRPQALLDEMPECCAFGLVA